MALLTAGALAEVVKLALGGSREKVIASDERRRVGELKDEDSKTRGADTECCSTQNSKPRK